MKKESIKNIRFDDEMMTLCFKDGRTVSVPLAFYPRLRHATKKQRNHWQMIGRDRGIHWPDIDEDLSIEGILHGIPSVEYRKPRRASSKQQSHELRV